MWFGHGSSPLAWGTVSGDLTRDRPKRFIPTRVGNRFMRSMRSMRASVHPHSRGEQEVGSLRLGRYPGSSPLAWGTGSTTWPDQMAARFIPTRVGNRFLRVIDESPAPVHPHSRGEQHVTFPSSSTTRGSSPLAWGTDLRFV